MKDNSNSVNINLNRVMVIDSLKSKLAVLQEEFVKVKKMEDQYELDKKSYRQDVVNAAMKAVKDGAEVKDIDSYSDYTTIRIVFNAKDIVEPKNPRYELRKNAREIQEDINMIESNIKLLEMCSEETIKSKSYGNILSFL